MPGQVMNLQLGSTISGRTVFQGTSSPPSDLKTVRITFAPAPGSPLGGTTANVVAAADGTFSVVGATPGTYRISASVGAPATTGWSLKSAIVSGSTRDVLDTPIEIKPGEDITGLTLTFTDQPAELSGTLIDAKGKPVAGYIVVVFSTDRSYWTASGRRGRPMLSGQDGRFKVTGLPAGEYYLAVINDVDLPDMGDAAFLEPLAAQSLKLKLADGEKRVQDLKLAGGG